MHTIATFLMQMGPGGDHDMDWGDHWWMPTIVLVVLLITIGLIVWAIIATTRTPRSPVSTSTGPTAKELLDRRLATGDISPEDYEARRKLLDG